MSSQGQKCSQCVSVNEAGGAGLTLHCGSLPLKLWAVCVIRTCCFLAALNDRIFPAQYVQNVSLCMWAGARRDV